MGQRLVPDPAGQGAGQQRHRSGGQPAGVRRAGQQVGAHDVRESGQGEDQGAQQTAEQADPPGVGDRAVRFGVAARNPCVQLLGEGEGVLAPVGESDLVVAHAVGLDDGGDLVGVHGGGDQVAHPRGEFVDRVGGGPVRAPGPRHVRQVVRPVLAALPRHQPQGTAHQPAPSAARGVFQGPRSWRVHSSRCSAACRSAPSSSR